VIAKNIMREKIGVTLLCLIVLEISLGGGGRFTAIGSVTLRMVLFVISLLFFFFKEKQLVKQEYLALVFVFALSLVFSTFMGMANNAPLDNIIEDIKSFSYFFILLFFASTINSIIRVRLVIKIIMISSFLMSIAYLLIYWGLESKIIDFKEIYNLTEDSGELVFRNESAFMYKGFLFPCIGIFMFFLNENYWSKITSLIMLYAVSLTYTRGLLISIFLILFSLLIIQSIHRKKFTYLLISSLILSFTAPSIISAFLDAAGPKEESDLIRIMTIDEVFSRINLQSFFIGHGFGIGVPIRPTHMEISFLEIFHKQGVLGILFWILVLLIISMKFINTYRTNQTKDSLPLYLSSIFIYIQSQTNPYLTNPIGVSMIVISIISMDVIAKDNINNTIKSKEPSQEFS
jgi:hypothetical protein